MQQTFIPFLISKLILQWSHKGLLCNQRFLSQLSMVAKAQCWKSGARSPNHQHIPISLLSYKKSRGSSYHSNYRSSYSEYVAPHVSASRFVQRPFFLAQHCTHTIIPLAIYSVTSCYNSWYNAYKNLHLQVNGHRMPSSELVGRPLTFLSGECDEVIFQISNNMFRKMTNTSPPQTPNKPICCRLAQYKKLHDTAALKMVRMATWGISKAPSNVPSRLVAKGAKGCIQQSYTCLCRESCVCRPHRLGPTLNICTSTICSTACILHNTNQRNALNSSTVSTKQRAVQR